jgi:hypothetical protein
VRRIFLAILFLAGGCAGTRGPASGPSVPEATRHEILGALKERNEAVSALRGFATVRYGSSLFGARGETAFAVRKPDRLRIDGLADFGLYHSRLALDGRALTILWPSDNRYFEGAATPESLARYLLVGLPPETIVAILLGVVPVREDDPGLRVMTLRKGAQFIVRGERVEAVVEPRDVPAGARTYVPVQYTVTDVDGHPVYRVGFDDYSREGRPLWFADRMTARFWENGPSRTKARIDVRFKEIEVNPQINSKTDAKLFELKIPKDAQRVSD